MLIYVALILIIAAAHYSNVPISIKPFCHYRHYKALQDFLSPLSVLPFSSLIIYSRAQVPSAFVHFLSKILHAKSYSILLLGTEVSCGVGCFCWPSPAVLFCSSLLELCFFSNLCCLCDFKQDFVCKADLKTIIILTILLNKFQIFIYYNGLIKVRLSYCIVLINWIINFGA